MAITASELRRDVYRLLDQALETGEPIEIERSGRTLRITADPAPSKLDRIPTNPDFIVGDPDELVHMDWSVYWDPDRAVDPERADEP